MPSPRALNFSLALILAITLGLTATAAAQTPCPAPGVAIPPGDCVNSSNVTYTESPSTTVNGLYTNQITGRVTATGNNWTALTVDDFANSGTVYASGTGTDTGGGSGYGYGIWANSGFTNSGTVYATGTGTSGIGGGYGIQVNGGFTNSGTLYASGEGYGYGIWVNNGFTNSGTVYATGTSGAGILVSGGDFTNSGTLYASGESSGYGILVSGGDFTNSGTVYATGTSGAGIWVNSGGFTNSGTVYASGEGSGYGISVNLGDFTNSGELILSSVGGTALYFQQFSPASTFKAQSDSSLIMVGSDPAMVFENYFGYVGILDIDPEAGLTMMNANEVGSNPKPFVLAQNVEDTGGNKFVLPDSGVFRYNQQWQPSGSGSTDGDYVVTVTRQAWASDLTGGQGGGFVAGLENYFLDNGTGSAFDTPAWSWLNLLHDINSGSTTAEVKGRGQDAARLNSAQSTGQSFHLVRNASQRASNVFVNKTRAPLKDNRAPSSGSGGSSTSVWLSPFYLTSTQDASDRSLSQVDSDWWGFSLGAAHSPQDNLSFGLGFHFLKGDFDSGRSYEADSTAWGLDIGLAANLGSGSYRPLLTAAISHTRHDFDQVRRVDGYAYKSSPDISVTTAALGLSQDFNLDQEGAFILRPKIGFDWTRTEMDGYIEQGTGPRALRVDSENFDSFRSELGTALAWKPVEALELELRAAWLHDFGDRAPVLTSVARDLPGLSLYTPRSDNSRNAANLGGSAAFEAGGGLNFTLDYDGLFNGDLDSHQIGASLKYVWRFAILSG